MIADLRDRHRERKHFARAAFVRTTGVSVIPSTLQRLHGFGYNGIVRIHLSTWLVLKLEGSVHSVPRDVTLPSLDTESGRSSMSQILIKKVRNPMSAFGTKETGPQRAIGESLPHKLVMTSTRCLFLINIPWPRNPQHCVCHRKCWMRFLDPRMRRLSPLRI